MRARGNLRASEEKGLCLAFSGFPTSFSGPAEESEKAEKGLISSKGGKTPLKPPFVTPTCAAAQMLLLPTQAVGPAANLSNSLAPAKFATNVHGTEPNPTSPSFPFPPSPTVHLAYHLAIVCPSFLPFLGPKAAKR